MVTCCSVGKVVHKQFITLVSKVYDEMLMQLILDPSEALMLK